LKTWLDAHTEILKVMERNQEAHCWLHPSRSLPGFFPWPSVSLCVHQAVFSIADSVTPHWLAALLTSSYITACSWPWKAHPQGGRFRWHQRR
jgi:hypothetical protein